MSFRLFGVPVRVHAFFWLLAILLGIDAARTSSWLAVPIWIGVVFVSVLAHELGHALAIRRHGLSPAIELHGMGGTTHWSEPVRVGRLADAVISLAGPLAGFLVGGLVFAAERLLVHDPLPILAEVALSALVWVNVGWSVFNLVPVLPFDGGHVLAAALGPRRARTTEVISFTIAVALAGVSAWTHQSLAAVLFAVSAMQSYQRYTLPPGTVLVNPIMGGAGSRSGPGILRRLWLKLRLKRLEAKAQGLRGAPAARHRASGPTLRVIQGGGGAPLKGAKDDKRYLN